jgi:hypothetical protein
MIDNFAYYKIIILPLKLKIKKRGCPSPIEGRLGEEQPPLTI